MKQKLLHKTLRSYLLFSISILIVAAPLFYVIIERLYIDDADEYLMLRKNEFLQYHQITLKEYEIPIWNKYNRDVKIEQYEKHISSDTIYFQNDVDKLTNENEPYRLLKSYVLIEGKPYTFSARINLVETEDLIKSILFVFLILITLLLIGLYFITKYLSIRLWKPFYDTVDKLKQFEIDKNPKIALQSTNIQEFQDLNTAILHLTESSHTTYLNQKEFTENAAHELQTPLAIFQLKLDLLLQTQDISEEQAEIIKGLYDTTMRLSKLNKSLLLMSKIENDQFIELKEIELEGLINHALSLYWEDIKNKNITIEQDVLNVKKIKMNASLAEILVNNLISNAVYHNISNGNIHILLKENELSIENTGIELKSSTTAYFERFKKSHANNNGTGLGLAIVKRICEVSEIKIEYVNVNHQHKMTINF